MDFSSALIELVNGKKIRRPDWRRLPCYIKIVNTDNKEEIKCLVQATSQYNFDASIILSKDWLIGESTEMDDTKTYHRFDEMVIALREGQKARLSAWKDQHIELDKQTKEIVLKHYIEIPFMPIYDHFIAEDWEIAE